MDLDLESILSLPNTGLVVDWIIAIKKTMEMVGVMDSDHGDIDFPKDQNGDGNGSGYELWCGNGFGDSYYSLGNGDSYFVVDFK